MSQAFCCRQGKLTNLLQGRSKETLTNQMILTSSCSFRLFISKNLFFWNIPGKKPLDPFTNIEPMCNTIRNFSRKEFSSYILFVYSPFYPDMGFACCHYACSCTELMPIDFLSLATATKTANFVQILSLLTCTK